MLFASTGERHWTGMLGSPYSSATLWNRGARTEGGAIKEEMKAFWDDRDETVPKRVNELDGKTVLSFPVSMPAANTLAPILGGYNRDGLGFFKGRIRNLRVSHACGM